MSIRSSLSRLQGKSMDCDKTKRDGWRDENILVVTPEDAARLNAIEQQVIRKIGDKLWGGVINGR